MEQEAYTMKRALEEANKLLSDTFGEAKQEAAVQLATFLYGVHSRDEFLRDQPTGSQGDYGGVPPIA